jgi:hypothetical protein
MKARRIAERKKSRKEELRIKNPPSPERYGATRKDEVRIKREATESQKEEG